MKREERVGWIDTRVKPEVIAAKVAALKVDVGDNGRFIFDGLGSATTTVAALLSSLDFKDEIPPTDRADLLLRAIGHTAKRHGAASNHGQLLTAIRREVDAFLARTPEQFRAVTTISFRPSGAFPARRTALGCKVFIRAGRRRAIDLSRWSTRRGASSTPLHGYSHVEVACAGRSPAEAMGFALDGLDYLRSMWNFHADFQRGRMSWGIPRPLNTIRLGAMHTLHRPDWQLAVEYPWEEREYVAPIVTPDLSAQWSAIRRTERKIHATVEGSALRDYLVRTLLAHVRALDEVRYDISLIRLWTALEVASGVREDADYGKLIRRISRAFKHPEATATSLEFIRNYRNQVVHQSPTFPTDDLYSESLLTLLRQISHGFLHYVLENAADMESEAAWWEYLDLPLDRDALERRARLARRALARRSV